MASLRVVLVSDTHGFHDRLEIPAGDVLIDAGDGCRSGTLEEAREWMDRLRSLPHADKLVIAGNHDRCFEHSAAAARELTGGLTYLQDSGCEIAGVRFWGAPWQPWFLSWAFNVERGPALAEKWSLIPSDTDVLVTHGPPMGILDETFDGRAVGCADLRAAIERIGPRLHVFGHIHEGYGAERHGPTLHVNASVCTLHYRPVQAPIVIDLPLDRRRPAELISVGRRL